jgi:hypothetical protein
MERRRVDGQLDRGLRTRSDGVVRRADGGVQDTVGGAVLDLPQLLALVGGERGHVDQAHDVARVRGGVGDDGATVGMPDGQDRPRDLAEDARDVGGVRGHTTERIDDGAYCNVGRLQALDHAAPAGTVGEGAVNEDDRHGPAGGVRIGHDDSFLPSPELARVAPLRR